MKHKSKIFEKLTEDAIADIRAKAADLRSKGGSMIRDLDAAGGGEYKVAMKHINQSSRFNKEANRLAGPDGDHNCENCGKSGATPGSGGSYCDSCRPGIRQ